MTDGGASSFSSWFFEAIGLDGEVTLDEGAELICDIGLDSLGFYNLLISLEDLDQSSPIETELFESLIYVRDVQAVYSNRVRNGGAQAGAKPPGSGARSVP
jgi:acyl carrier protein